MRSKLLSFLLILTLFLSVGMVNEVSAIHKDNHTKSTKTECKTKGDEKDTCKKGHNYKVYKVVNPTCKHTGTKYMKCSTCKIVKKITIPRTTHEYQTKIVKSTCKKTGYQYNICKHCNHTIKTIIPKLKHEYYVSKIVEPTYKKYDYKYSVCKYCKKTVKTIIPKLKNKEVYKMLDGSNQEYNGSGTIIFRSNAKFKNFTAVSIDGKIVNPDNYTVTEGSTIITLKEDYCKTLSDGKHTIKIISDNGNFATTNFVVNKKVVEEGPTLITGPEFNDILRSYHDDKYLSINNIKKIEFQYEGAPEGVETIDVSEAQDGSALAWFDGTTFYVAPKVTGQTLYANSDCHWMFAVDNLEASSYGPNNVEVLNFENFNTSKVTNMNSMFYETATSSNSFEIKGLENWDVSSVTNMGNMFMNAGLISTYTLDLSSWKNKVSNVTDYNSFDNNVEDKIISPWDI